MESCNENMRLCMWLLHFDQNLIELNIYYCGGFVQNTIHIELVVTIHILIHKSNVIDPFVFEWRMGCLKSASFYEITAQHFKSI